MGRFDEIKERHVGFHQAWWMRILGAKADNEMCDICDLLDIGERQEELLKRLKEKWGCS